MYFFPFQLCLTFSNKQVKVVTEGMVGDMEATEDMAEVITEEMVTEVS